MFVASIIVAAILSLALRASAMPKPEQYEVTGLKQYGAEGRYNGCIYIYMYMYMYMYVYMCICMYTWHTS
jgi:hypothetical protein